MFARTPIALAAVAAALAPACVDNHDHGVYVDPTYYEVESNDFYWCANGVGPISVGEHVPVRGDISDFGPDRYDGFALRANTPMQVEFRLYADEPGMDFDLALFDPYTGTTAATWETGAQPEAGSFSVLSYGMEFHLVVNSFVGSGGYTLEVCAFPLYGDGAPGNGGLHATGALRAPTARDWSAYLQPSQAAAETLARPWIEVQTWWIDERSGQVLGPAQRGWILADRKD